MKQAGTRQQAMLFLVTLSLFLAQHLLNMDRRPRPLWPSGQNGRLPAILTLPRQIVQQGIPHRPIGMLTGGMNDQPRWLIDDQQVMILIDNLDASKFHALSIDESAVTVKIYGYKKCLFHAVKFL